MITTATAKLHGRRRGPTTQHEHTLASHKRALVAHCRAPQRSPVVSDVARA